MKIPYVFNIQKFSTHDGPGIRTTIFFKGCPIKCLWCHNPESQNYEAETMLTKDGKEEVVGEQYSVRELVKKVQKDQIFYDQSGGGVTLSGGEVMTQDMDYIEALVKELHRVGISVAIDTCGVAPTKNFERILPYVDLFLYDLKFISSQLHKKYTGASNTIVLKNLRFLSEHQANVNLRLIMLAQINTEKEAIDGIHFWLKENHINVSSVSLLPYHDFGQDKYRRLERPCTQNFEKPTDEQLEEIKDSFQNAGYLVKIGG